MTTKELLALVGKWRDTEAADRDVLHHGQLDAEEHNWHMASAATFKLCADELAPIATALCAEVEALRKDAERYRYIRTLAAGRPEAFGPVEDAAFAASYGDPGKFDFNIDAAMNQEQGKVGVAVWIRHLH